MLLTALAEGCTLFFTLWNSNHCSGSTSTSLTVVGDNQCILLDSTTDLSIYVNCTSDSLDIYSNDTMCSGSPSFSPQEGTCLQVGGLSLSYSRYLSGTPNVTKGCSVSGKIWDIGDCTGVPSYYVGFAVQTGVCVELPFNPSGYTSGFLNCTTQQVTGFATPNCTSTNTTFGSSCTNNLLTGYSLEFTFNTQQSLPSPSPHPSPSPGHSGETATLYSWLDVLWASFNVIKAAYF